MAGHLNPNLFIQLSNAQLNIGKIGSDQKVDQWHFDSINFVSGWFNISDLTS